MDIKQMQYLGDFLIQAGYCVGMYEVLDGRKVDHYRLVIVDNPDWRKRTEEILEPLSDTLNGLHQFHALEAHLETIKNLPAHQLWLNSTHKCVGVGYVKRLNRLVWMIAQYVKDYS